MAVNNSRPSKNKIIMQQVFNKKKARFPVNFVSLYKTKSNHLDVMLDAIGTTINNKIMHIRQPRESKHIAQVPIRDFPRPIILQHTNKKQNHVQHHL